MNTQHATRIMTSSSAAMIGGAATATSLDTFELFHKLPAEVKQTIYRQYFDYTKIDFRPPNIGPTYIIDHIDCCPRVSCHSPVKMCRSEYDGYNCKDPSDGEVTMFKPPRASRLSLLTASWEINTDATPVFYERSNICFDRSDTLSRYLFQRQQQAAMILEITIKFRSQCTKYIPSGIVSRCHRLKYLNISLDIEKAVSSRVSDRYLHDPLPSNLRNTPGNALPRLQNVLEYCIRGMARLLAERGEPSSILTLMEPLSAKYLDYKGQLLLRQISLPQPSLPEGYAQLRQAPHRRIFRG